MQLRHPWVWARAHELAHMTRRHTNYKFTYYNVIHYTFLSAARNLNTHTHMQPTTESAGTIHCNRIYLFTLYARINIKRNFEQLTECLNAFWHFFFRFVSIPCSWYVIIEPFKREKKIRMVVIGNICVIKRATIVNNGQHMKTNDRAQPQAKEPESILWIT